MKIFWMIQNVYLTKMANIVLTTWKQNNSIKIVDKINNLSEQTLVNFIVYATSLEAIRLDDNRWKNMCCINPTKEIYKKIMT